MIETKKRLGRPPKYHLDKKKILSAIKETDGTYRGVAHQLKCTTQAIHNWLLKHPEVSRSLFKKENRHPKGVPVAPDTLSYLEAMHPAKLNNGCLVERMECYAYGIRAMERLKEETQYRMDRAIHPTSQEIKLDREIVSRLKKRITMFKAILVRLDDKARGNELGKLIPGGLNRWRVGHSH